MNSASLVELALSAQGCTQKELAAKLKVSPGQISKWKKGEHISFEMSQKLSELAHLDGLDPDVVLTAGSKEDAKKWVRLIRYLAKLAYESAETGYNTAPLVEDMDEDNNFMYWKTFDVLREIGFTIPKPFPRELEACIEEKDDGQSIDRSEPASLIYRIFKSYTDVYGFYAAFILDFLYDDKLDAANIPAWDIEPEMLRLAASKLDIDSEKYPKFPHFKYKVEVEFSEMISDLKERAFRAGIPLKAELMDLVFDSHDQLGASAEEKSFGITDNRIHPDIYMNELLVGMRIIHQVLPAIMRKLDMEEEFELDTSKLFLKRN